MPRIVLKHLSGSKANQEQTFSLEEHPELVFGRDPSSQIAFDPDRDDVVSRRHAKITRDGADQGRFIFTDLGSRNGVLINNKRIHGAAPVMHGDVIQLGEGGPRLRFELDPAPTAPLNATRIVAPATREVASSREPGPGASMPEQVSTAGSGARPIGRGTVERLISLSQSQSRKSLVTAAAAVLGVVVLVGGFFAYNAVSTRRTLSTQAAATSKEMERLRNAMTPTKVAEMYGPATVLLEVSWKLIDTYTGRQVYHRYHYVTKDGARRSVPDYVVLSVDPPQTEPFLVTSEKNWEGGGADNIPIGGVHTGSGFAIDASGFILTNRHVSATWLSRGLLNLPLGESGSGALYRCPGGEAVKTDDGKPLVMDERFVRSAMLHWIPARSTMLDCKKVRTDQLAGRNDRLDVTFAGTSQRIHATRAQESDRHDVALIKVETPGNVTSVALAPEGNDASVKAGDPVTILGYPGVSPQQFVRTTSRDMLAPLPTERSVPGPTVTTGSVGRVFRGTQDVVGGDAADYLSLCGDCYQLTANATGSGNSGGPVFDQSGHAIAIFYAGGTRGGATVTFAVPLKFARELMSVSKAFK